MTNHIFQRWLITLMLLGAYTAALAQVLTNDGGSITVSNAASLTVQGDFENKNTASINSQGIIYVGGDFANNTGTGLMSGTGYVILNDSNLQHISGNAATTFHYVEVRNGGGVQLDANIAVDSAMNLVSGKVDVTDKFVSLGSTAYIQENNNNYFYGSQGGGIQALRRLGTASNDNVGQMGLVISSSSNLGDTRITRRHATVQIGSGTSINRFYEVTPGAGFSGTADMQFGYLPHELNGQAPNMLGLFYSLPGGAPFASRGGTANAAARNVALNGVNPQGQWLMSADATTRILDLRPALEVGMSPNPLKAGSLLSLSGLEPGSYSLELIDVHGKKVFGQQINSTNSAQSIKVNTPNLAAGIYSLKLQSDDFKPSVSKLIITQ